MTEWTLTNECVPVTGGWLSRWDADQNYYLVEWDADKVCFWDQGTQYLKQELTYWMSVREPPEEISSSESLSLGS